MEEIEKRGPGRPKKLVPAGKPSFIRASSHDLEPLLRNLKRVSKDAINALEDGLKSNDEKTRMKCAELLLQYHVAVSKEINTDAIQRVVAELRFNNSNSVKDINENSHTKPLVDFNNIRDV